MLPYCLHLSNFTRTHRTDYKKSYICRLFIDVVLLLLKINAAESLATAVIGIEDTIGRSIF